MTSWNDYSSVGVGALSVSHGTYGMDVCEALPGLGKVGVGSGSLAWGPELDAA